MTWDTERKKSGRRPFQVVEFDLDYCQETYGSAPCTAALSASTPNKCFNTRVTCQDPANYNPASKTYRCCSPIEGIPRAYSAIPSLRSVSMTPTELDPGKSLGKRASVVVTLQDHPYHDRGIDKYVDERISGAAAFDSSTYVPYEQGTYFGKLRARNPYYIGREMRVLTGYLPYDHSLPANEQPSWSEAQVVANLRSRRYVIEMMEGPDANGAFRITGKDILKLADDDRSVCPTASNGRLESDINSAATSATLVPDGIGSEYGASGTILIGSELMTFTRTGDSLTLTRGTDGTTATDHSAGNSVQEALRFTDQRADQIIQTLLEDYAGIPSALLPTTDWATEAGTWAAYKYSAVIHTPTGVSQLINELLLHASAYMWWDEIAEEVKFRCIKPQSSLEIIDENSNILEENFSRVDKPSERISRVVIRYGLINPTARMSDLNNFDSIFSLVDDDAESTDEYGQTRVKEVRSRWLNQTDMARTQASTMASRLLMRYRDNPVEYKLKLDAKDSDIWIGDIVSIQHRLTQNSLGESEAKVAQVLRVEETEEQQYEYRLKSEELSVGWAFPIKVGNTLDTGGVSTSGIEYLDDTHILVQTSSGFFRLLSWDGSDWTEDDTESIANARGFARLDSTDFIFVFFRSPDIEFETYRWNGINSWIKQGNTYTFILGGTAADVPDVCAMTSTRVAIYDNSTEELVAFDWDGTDWSETGNRLDRSSDPISEIYAFRSNAIVSREFGGSLAVDVRVFEFDGTDWSQLGSTTALDFSPYTGAIPVFSVVVGSSTDIVFCSAATVGGNARQVLGTIRWNGDTFDRVHPDFDYGLGLTAQIKVFDSSPYILAAILFGTATSDVYVETVRFIYAEL